MPQALPTKPPSDSDLCGVLHEGDDAQAWEAMKLLYQRHAPRAAAGVARVLGPQHAQEGLEIVHDVCMELFLRRRRERFKSFVSLLSWYVQRRCVSWIRREKQIASTTRANAQLLTRPSPRSTLSPLGKLELEEQRRRLEEAIRRMPPNYQQPLRLRLQGMKNQQISRVMGLTPSAVRVRISRALAWLRRELVEEPKTCNARTLRPNHGHQG